jgi:hypothetical protein
MTSNLQNTYHFRRLLLRQAFKIIEKRPKSLKLQQSFNGIQIESNRGVEKAVY